VTIVVSLLYAAEVALDGYWRWTAFAIALVMLRRFATERSRVGLSNWFAATVLGVGAAQTQSPILALTAVLVVVPRQSAQAAAWLTLVALGIHVLWWRYLGAMPLDRVPEWLAALASWIGGSAFNVTSAGVAARGHFIRFSAVPIAAVSIPLLIALIQLKAPGTAALRFIGFLILALLASFTTVAALTLSGHVHFLATAGWLLAPIGFGTLGAVLLNGQSKPVEGPWGILGSAVLAVTVLWLWGVEPESRPLRIAFDEAHGKWETIEAPFGTSRYGRDTVYNYTLLARWLQTKHAVIPIREHWTSIDSDVLVLKMPTAFYADGEKAAIDAFIRKGGLLLVLGDHTNLYGTAFIINDLLGRYGLEIEATATVPLTGDHYDYRPAWWLRTRYLQAVEYIQFQTAASIKTRHPLAIPLLVGDRVVAEDADYSNERFFGELHPGPEDRHPPIVLAAERRLGRGRIILFADSTIFSSFSMMAPGNRELFQNLIEQGTTHRSVLRLALIGAVFLFAFAGVRDHRAALALAIAPVVLAFTTASSPQSSALETYPADWVDFDLLHSRLELRFDPLGTHGPAIDDYSTFFAWVGRSGAMPRATRWPYESPSRPTILVNPDKPFSVPELEQIERYLKQGGRLLVLDDARFSTRSAASALMDRLGVAIRPTPQVVGLHDPGPPVLSANLLAVPFDLLREDRQALGRERGRVSEPRQVLAGTAPLILDDRGTVVAGQRQVGRGLVIFIQNSAMFSDFGIGDVWGGQEVDPERERVYQLLYDLFGLLSRKESGEVHLVPSAR